MLIDEYLLGQAFDNYQLSVTKKVFNQFEIYHESFGLNNVLIFSKQKQINPIYILSACFRYHIFLNRKRVKVPYLLAENLTTDFVKKAYQATNRYDQKRFKTMLDSGHTYLSLDSFLLKALRMIGLSDEINLTYYQQLNTNMLDQYQHEPYVDLTQERLHRMLLKQHCNLYQAQALQEGLVSFNPLLILLNGEIQQLIQKLIKLNYYQTYYYGLQNQSYQRNVEENQYLYRAHLYLKKQGIVIND